MKELKPTINDGMVILRERKKEISLEDVHTALDMLKYFEWYGKISFLDGEHPNMLLSVCPICNGLDPNDSNAALPHLKNVYEKSAGHKPNCKLNDIIQSLEYTKIEVLKEPKVFSTLSIIEKD
jgi:hypothetical protein